MKGIRVAVHGAAGKMGQEVVGAILKQKGMFWTILILFILLFRLDGRLK